MLSLPRSALLALVTLACGATTPSAPASTPATLAPPPGRPALAPDPLAAQIDPIFSDLSKPGTPGCAVAVYRAGTIAFARGYGLANLEHDLPITPSTTFDIGSVSKQFTAMAVLLLAQDGKISLDDDVRKYVPELPVYGRKPITLRHLLHHTSGLRDYAGLLVLSGFNEADVTNDDDGLYAIVHQKALNFPTGTAWSYSNTGYFLLSIVVKRATGKTLAAFAKERIFDPLGMTSTLILDDHTRLVPRRATAYRPRDGGGFGIEMSDYEQTGDGAVQTTVEDLAKWDANFYDPKVGGKAALDLMRTPGKLDDGKPLWYAMGLGETKTNGIVREEHNGAWGGYRADLLRFPSERLTVACLCNVANGEPEARADKVAMALIPKLAPPAAPAEGTAPSPSGDGAPPAKAVAIPPADLAAVVGAYYDPESFQVRTVSLDKGTIHLGFQLAPGGDGRDLEAIDARTFRVLGVPRGAATRYRFEPAAGKTPAHLVRIPTDDEPTTLVRFEPFAPTPSALAEYAGRYTSEEALDEMRIAAVDGKLFPGEWGRTLEKAPLQPLVRDVFTMEDGALQFERDPRGKIRGLRLSTERIRGMVWTRRAEK